MVSTTTASNFTSLCKDQDIPYSMLSGSSTYPDLPREKKEKATLSEKRLTECSVLRKLTYLRLIENFQKNETPTFIEHIDCALKLLESQPNAMVIFSGYVHVRYNLWDVY